MKSLVAMFMCIGTVIMLSSPLSMASEQCSRSDKQTKYLLLDSRIIDSVQNAKLTLGEARKHSANPLFGEDKPWEPRFDNLYPNVMYDQQEQIYKCWYSPFIVDHSAKGMTLQERKSKPYRAPRNREMGVCYAISKDGITWDKPELGIVAFDGSKNNNILCRLPHGSGVFKDIGEKDASKRYKMLTRDTDENSVAVAFSPDGLNWTEMILCPEINRVDYDGTHFNALWDTELGTYVGFTRIRDDGIRQVGRTVSNDFLKWTTADMVFEGIEDHLQIYSMPVFKLAGVYLGLPVIFNTMSDRSHTELAWSPDTINWYRIDPGTPLIANSTTEGDYDWGCAYSAAYPVFLDNEIRVYYGGSNGLHTSWRDGFLCLATLRPDGFAGYEPRSADGAAIITTKPLKGDVASLSITADVQTGGSVRVAVVDGHGRELARAKPVTQTVTGARIAWKRNVEVSRSKGIRLRFELKDARLYAFQIFPGCLDKQTFDPFGLAGKTHFAITPEDRTGSEWWLARHQQVLERIAQGNIDLIMVGDSITHNWESTGKKVWDQYYASRSAVNFGFGGDGTESVIWRFDNGEIDGINPKLAILMIGTNNSNGEDHTPEEIADGIKAICTRMRAKMPKTKILILAIFPRGFGSDEQREALGHSTTFNPQWAKNDQASKIASRIADGKHIFYLDINEAFLDEKGILTREVMPDFVHLSEKGYRLWAEALEPTIAELMGEK